MTQEEKAKAYDKALERAKKELNTCGSQDCDAARQIFRFFPELKKNEDEQHRKWILEYLYDGLRKSDEQFKDQFKYAIDWFEKQGEHNDLSKVPSREVILAIWELGNEWKELTNGVCVTVHGTQLDFIRKHWYENEYLYRKNLKTMSGKPADESESKFRDGDWIINKLTGSIYQIKNCIENVSNHKYGYDLTDGGYLGSDAIDRTYHLWTIQDAKDGDVIADSKMGAILMFRGIGNTNWDDVIDYHCYYDCHLKDFIVQEGVEHWGNIENNQMVPATKEQRTLLFQKIKEAGYKWDAEKKELKKIEKQGDQKPNDKVEPKFRVGDRVNQNDREDEEYNILTIASVYIDEHCYICHQGSVIDFEEQDLWHIVEQKPVWSEEDEHYKNGLIGLVENSKAGLPINLRGEAADKCIDWLKSIKDRVQSQPKQEWDENV